MRTISDVVFHTHIADHQLFGCVVAGRAEFTADHFVCEENTKWLLPIPAPLPKPCYITVWLKAEGLMAIQGTGKTVAIYANIKGLLPAVARAPLRQCLAFGPKGHIQQDALCILLPRPSAISGAAKDHRPDLVVIVTGAWAASPIHLLLTQGGAGFHFRGGGGQ